MPANPVSHRRRWAILATGAVVVVLVVVIVAVPLPHDFAFSLPEEATCSPSIQTDSFARGSSVAGSWHTDTPGTVEVTIVDPSGTTIYGQSGTNGTFSFSAGSGTYSFESRPVTTQHLGCVASPPVSVSGSWSATEAQVLGL